MFLCLCIWPKLFIFKIFGVRLSGEWVSVCEYVCDVPIVHIGYVLNDVIGKTIKM